MTTQTFLPLHVNIAVLTNAARVPHVEQTHLYFHSHESLSMSLNFHGTKILCFLQLGALRCSASNCAVARYTLLTHSLPR